MSALAPDAPASAVPVMPESLGRYLAAATPDELPRLAAYLDRGAALVDRAAIDVLHHLRPALHAKIDAPPSSRLRRYLRLLDTFCDECRHDGQFGTPAHREAAFALLYFLKGFDRIPDHVPEVGLADDSLLVQLVLQRRASTLRAHWLRRRRLWPL